MNLPFRFGHNELAQGSIGLVNEVIEARRYGNRVIQLLREVGNNCTDCTPTPTADVNADLVRGVSKANATGGDIFISFHINAYNGQAHGAENEVYDSSSNIAIGMSNRICANLAKLGLTNRGTKIKGDDLYELRMTDMQCIIVEPFFLDNHDDVNIYRNNFEQFCRAIANGIDPRVSLTVPTPTPSNPDRVCIDNPKNGFTTDSTFELNGWAISSAKQIELLLNGGSCGKQPLTVDRPDVLKAYPYAKVSKLGFKWGISIDSLKMGANTLTIWSGNAKQDIVVTRVPKVCPTCHRPL